MPLPKMDNKAGRATKFRENFNLFLIDRASDNPNGHYVKFCMLVSEINVR